MSFQAKLATGRSGEQWIANWMISLGYSVMPVYDKESGDYKGPQIFGPGGNLVAPDIFAFNATGKALWVEAKHKSAFTWHRISARWVTGIDIKYYDDYIKVAASQPGWPLWLLFLHRRGVAKDTPAGLVSPSGLFGERLDVLREKENHRYGSMVYWAHESLRALATYDEVLAASPKEVRHD